MDALEMQDLMDDVAAVMKAVVDRAVTPLIERITTLEADAREQKSISIRIDSLQSNDEEIRASLLKAVEDVVSKSAFSEWQAKARAKAAERKSEITDRLDALDRKVGDLPAPREAVTIADVREIAQNEMAGLKSLIEALPPAPVLPDVRTMIDEQLNARLPTDMEANVKEIARAAVAELPVPQDGKSVTVDDVMPLIDASIAERIAAIPLAKDGASVSTEDVAPMIEAEVAKRVSELPAAKDGEPGKDADPEAMRTMIQDAVSALPPATPGKDADPEVMRVMIAEAVASLPPAQPGKDADPAVVKQMVDEAVAAIPPARDGKDVDMEAVEAMLTASTENAQARVSEAIAAIPVPKDADMDAVHARLDDIKTEALRQVAEAVAAIRVPEDGKSVTIEEALPVMQEALTKAIETVDANINTDGDLIVTLPNGKAKNAGRALGCDGADIDWDSVRANLAEMFEAWPKPQDGRDGKLPIVKAWEDAVHYEGDVVTFEGRLYQAQRDTGKAPDSADWLCIAERGMDGKDGLSLRVRGTWLETNDYEALDIAALNGASFVAKRDNPGTCPGDGWQLIAAQGKRGQPGERSPGIKGDRGEPGLPVIASHVSEEGLVTIVNGDGSEVTIDLYPLLSKLK